MNAHTPAQLLEELGITEPEELDLEAIAEHCGATILYEPLHGCSARILGFGDRAIITINQEANRGRQRFSGGHELGHWIRDRGRVAFECNERALVEWGRATPESRANQYAVDLLLPPVMFVPRAAGRSMTFDTVRSLADTFEMSLTAVALRLVEHGSFPAMLVCASTHGRLWFRRGPSVPDSLWPTDEPGRGSLAHQLLRGHDEFSGPVDLSADEWINSEGASAYLIREDSLRIMPDVVLSLLWWADEAQLLELDEDE